MHFGDEEKPGRKAALQKLVEMMGTHTTSKLASAKKPAMAIEVEGSPDEEEGESANEEAMEGGEPSEEDKAKIAELYHRYCK